MREKTRRRVKRTFGRTRNLVMFISLLLILCTVVGGTLAWLVAQTEPVVNTFTYGDINITLEETDTGDNDNNSNTNEYIMMPGQNISKDPKVTVKANSENCWLFVKLDKSQNFDQFMTYEIADGWTALTGVDGVYYRTVDKASIDAEFTVIKNNTVTVKDTVTKEMLNALDANGAGNYPTLTVVSYAVQRDSNVATAADAWSKIN